jgi:hypothetical protein
VNGRDPKNQLKTGGGFSMFFPLFVGFQHVSTILLVMQDFATIHSIIIIPQLVNQRVVLKTKQMMLFSAR